jgi:hypothetical protein
MIISRSSSAARFSTDPIAASLSGFLAPSNSPSARRSVESGTPARLDLERLYPSLLFRAAESRRTPVLRAAGAR